MTDYKSTIAELHYLADWAKHHLDKAKIANDAAGAIEALQKEVSTLDVLLEELNYPAFQYDGQITSIANLIDEGTNITITGDGTEANPYVISSTGGGGSQNLQQVTNEGNETTNHIKVKLIDSIALNQLKFRL